MGQIVLLDDLTINKIAAGEVIERPANVVKELIENSIDAGATSISIDIENGGISYIRITDNGKGIAPDDVEMAFERHATSKIRAVEDLIKVSTMGFRGEALASIAAIAKVELISRTKDNETGIKVLVAGGKILSKEECGAPIGTTITIRELFFNTPVRYKFLKKDYTEGGYIEDTVSRIALINTLISFKLRNNKKDILQTSGKGDMQAVVYNIYGKDIAKNLLPVKFEYENIKVTGVVGKPEIARSNRSNQLFYINGRYIKDKVLSAATEEAYKTLIPHNKYGFCIINLELNPELVDVNVHPAKLEVRFSNEGQVFKAINIAIKEALLKTDITIDSNENTQAHGEDSVNGKSSNVVSFENILKNSYENKKNNNEHEKLSKGLFGMFRNVKTEQPVVKEGKTIEDLNEKYDTTMLDSKEDNNNVVNENDDIKIANTNENDKNEKLELHIEDNKAEINEIEILNKESNTQTNIFANLEIEEKANIPEYKILGVAFSTYILLELEDDIYVLDQHAAHERILYEKIKKNFYKEGGKEVQTLLLPDIVELPRRDMHIVRDHMELFEQSGFILEEFGDSTIKITGVPVICFEMDTKALFLDIIDGIDITNRTNKQDIEEKFISTVACKAAVKANMALEESEIRVLLDELLVLENSFTCPHGRPTAIRITKAEIEKKFGRR